MTHPHGTPESHHPAPRPTGPTPAGRMTLTFPTPTISGLMLPTADTPPDPRWAKTAATTFLTRAAPRPDRKTLAASLHRWDTYQHNVGCAALFVVIPPASTTVLATLEWDLVDNAEPELLDLDTLTAEMRIPRPATVSGPDVTTIELPQGPAVRVHWFRTATPPDSPPDPDATATPQPAVIEEQLAIVIPFPAPRVTAVITGSWPTIAAIDELTTLVETAAAHITITPL